MCEVHKSTFKQKNQIVKGFYQVAQRVANKVIRCGLVPKCAKRLVDTKSILLQPFAKMCKLPRCVKFTKVRLSKKTKLLKVFIKLLNVLQIK